MSPATVNRLAAQDSVVVPRTPVYLRLDSIEQALRNGGLTVEGEGYAVGYAVAEDNLRIGHRVVADCVNPWPLTRDAWRAVATRTNVESIDQPRLVIDTSVMSIADAVHRIRQALVELPSNDLAGLGSVVYVKGFRTATPVGS
ncbi:MAG: hypothetical protein IT178_20135 [Acidobacteria bacterium]|nr:hypothetical protein [Acidobacteriota bacterium]